jgi:hypothetical protein
LEGSEISRLLFSAEKNSAVPEIQPQQKIQALYEVPTSSTSITDMMFNSCRKSQLTSSL